MKVHNLDDPSSRANQLHCVGACGAIYSNKKCHDNDHYFSGTARWNLWDKWIGREHLVSIKVWGDEDCPTTDFQ